MAQSLIIGPLSFVTKPKPGVATSGLASFDACHFNLPNSMAAARKKKKKEKNWKTAETVKTVVNRSKRS
jgi:hypothetical protein